MSRITTPLEIYKLLPKSNCGQCRISACLAFAAAVIKQEKRLGDCPHLNKGVLARYEAKIDRPLDMEGIREKQLKELKKKISTIDITEGLLEISVFHLLVNKSRLLYSYGNVADQDLCA